MVYDINAITQMVKNLPICPNKIVDSSYASKIKDSLDTSYYSIESITYGMSKLVILINNADFVIKIPLNGARNNPFIHANNSVRWDYCLTESLRYQEAKKDGKEDFFAETKLICHTKTKYPVYIQERCYTYASYFFDSAGLDDDLPSQNGWWDDFSEEAPSLATELSIYLNTKGWNEDLHDENIGFLEEDGRHVLIDYSGFNY